MTDRPFAIGDEVHWTKRTIAGSGMNISVHHGEIRSIDGGDAVIRPNNKKRSIRVPLRCLRLKGEPSYLNELMGIGKTKAEVTP